MPGLVIPRIETVAIFFAKDFLELTLRLKEYLFLMTETEDAGVGLSFEELADVKGGGQSLAESARHDD